MATIACIGCGTVGSAWAAVFANGGHDVILYDSAPTLIVEFSLPLITNTLGLLAGNDALSAPAADILSRISSAASLGDAATRADYIQESVSEDVPLKRSIFKALSQHARPDTILASSTSALKGSDFMADITRPERALVAHPVNPPSLIPLVELCPTPLTSDETLSKTSDLLTGAGMKPIVLNKEIDGFILNRLQYTLVAEAMHLVGEGYCSAADIDRVMTDGLALRWANIGPFETAHLNAKNGSAELVAQLGPMMRKMGADAKTDYDWPDTLATDIHDQLCQHTPVADIAKRQEWRNQKILDVRALQNSKKNGE